MKKRSYVLLFILFVIIFCPHNMICAEEHVVGQDSIYVFPFKLQTIEEEAFSGVSAETLIFSEGLLRIEDNAFADDLCLKQVRLPSTIEYISESAFSSYADLTIHSVKNGYAEEWADNHGIPFVPEKIWESLLFSTMKMQNSQKVVEGYKHRIGKAGIIVLLNVRRYVNNRSMRPQDRAELNPIDYRFP